MPLVSHSRTSLPSSLPQRPFLRLRFTAFCPFVSHLRLQFSLVCIVLLCVRSSASARMQLQLFERTHAQRSAHHLFSFFSSHFLRLSSFLFRSFSLSFSSFPCFFRSTVGWFLGGSISKAICGRKGRGQSLTQDHDPFLSLFYNTRTRTRPNTYTYIHKRCCVGG